MNKKTGISIILTTIAVLILVSVATIALFWTGDIVTNVHQEVRVENGRAVPDHVTTYFDLEESGTYELHLQWGVDEDLRYITVMQMTDAAGNVVQELYGNAMDVNLTKDLQEGRYDIAYRFLTSEEDLSAYEELIDLSHYGVSGDFFEDGSFEVNYLAEVKPQHSRAYSMGLLTGVIIVIALVVIIVFSSKKFKNPGVDFDERQELARGLAFKNAFFTQLACQLLFMFLKVLNVPLRVEQGMDFMIPMYIGIVVFATYAILHDAYFSLREKQRANVFLFVVILVINLIGFITSIRDGSAFQGGYLCFRDANLLMVILFTYILILLWVKNILDKREEEDE